MSGPLEPGARLDGYRIERELGSGGMGTVYLAEHLALGRPVALKILSERHGGDAAFRDRFAREARLAARLDHVNLVPVYDAGVSADGPWIAMRYVAGEDLAARLRRVGGSLAPREAVRILSALAAGLDHAHGQGLVHRDVKPANVLLEEIADRSAAAAAGGARVLLADFGLTKDLEGAEDLTQTGALLGTVDYMAPEQIEGGHVDARTDVYALAALFVTLLSGEPAYTGTTMARLYAHVNAEPPRLDARRPELAPFQAIVAAGLAKDPGDRPASAGALAQAARDALGGEDTVAVPGRGADRAAPLLGATLPADPPAPAAPRRPRPPENRPAPPRPRDRTVVTPAAARPDRGDETRASAAPTALRRPAPGGYRGDDGPGDDRPSRTVPPAAWVALAALVVAIGIAAAIALGSGGGGDDGTTRESRGGGGDATTGTRTSTTSTGTTTGGSTSTGGTGTGTGSSTATTAQDGSIAVRGGGQIPAGAATTDPDAGTPGPGGSATAEYVAPGGAWRGIVVRPGGEWRTPRRSTTGQGGVIERLRQRGPGGRILLIDHTPSQPATFDASRSVERRSIPNQVGPAATGYRFPGDGFAGCSTAWCVDVPLNASTSSGPGWGILVGADDPEQAWGLAARVAASIRQGP